MSTRHSLGTLVLAGRSYPVTRIAFARGGLTVTAAATAREDQAAADGAPVTVFGTDGHGAGQGGTVTCPAARRGQRVTIDLFIDWDGTLDGGVLPELSQLPGSGQPAE
jgi:hypothetical protein